MTALTWLVYSAIALAFLFDFINGFHDAANSIATIVSTGVLKPLVAVLWAAFFNFIAFLFFPLAVANTIGTGLIEPSIVTPYLVITALSAAIIWGLITWYFGLPSSSSHALIGGLVGAGYAKAGIKILETKGLIKVGLAIIFSPLIGLVLASLLITMVSYFTRYHTTPVAERRFGYGQFISAAFLSLGHGGNDAQKTMGVIAVLLFSAGLLGNKFYVPLWVVITANLVMALGTLAGGWRIVNTLGSKITQLNKKSGFCAESAAAVTLLTAMSLGVPVSTTHTITGAIAGVGINEGIYGIRWNIIKKIIIAWILTVPAAGLIAAIFVVSSHAIPILKPLI